MRNGLRISLLTAGLAAILGCGSGTPEPEIMHTGELRELNKDARQYLSQEGLSDSQINTIPQEVLRLEPRFVREFSTRGAFFNFADGYVDALETCGTNERILEYEGILLEGMWFLCATDVPPEYARAFAKSDALGPGPYGLGAAFIIRSAHMTGMQLEDYEEYDEIYVDENTQPNLKRELPPLLFANGISSDDYKEYAWGTDAWDMITLHQAGVSGPEVAQWGDCLSAHEIASLATEGYPAEKSRELCAVAERYGLDISGADMLWFEEQGTTLEQVHTAAQDEYKAIRERFQ